MFKHIIKQDGKNDEDKIMEWGLELSENGFLHLMCNDWVVMRINPDGTALPLDGAKRAGLPYDGLGYFKIVY